jgi:hypothetical protein
VIELLIGVTCAIAAFNLFVSLRVLRDDLTPLQRAGQFAVVWLVPILGALLARFLHSRCNKNHSLAAQGVTRLRKAQVMILAKAENR